MSAIKYYIVPQDIYEQIYQQVPRLSEKIATLPSQSRSKAKILLQYLGGLINFDEFGRLRDYKQNVFDYVNYAVRGKDQPLDWYEFLLLLSEAPKELLAKRVKEELKLAQKHGR